MTEVRPPLIAGDVLTRPELRHLRRVSGLRGVGLVLHAWAVIIGAMGLWNVPPAHALLLAKGYRPRMEMAGSYAAVIRRVTSSA